MASASGLKSCSVGIKVGDNCHQLSYCRKQCIYNTTDLDEEQVKLMKMRARIEKLDTVYHHHQTIFFHWCESLQVVFIILVSVFIFIGIVFYIFFNIKRFLICNYRGVHRHVSSKEK